MTRPGDQGRQVMPVGRVSDHIQIGHSTALTRRLVADASHSDRDHAREFRSRGICREESHLRSKIGLEV